MSSRTSHSLENLSLIVTEARKLGIGLVISHQTVKQLTKQLFSEVLDNTATKIIFRVAGDDRATFSASMDVENKEELTRTLTSLPDSSAVIKLRAGFSEEPVYRPLRYSPEKLHSKIC